MRFFYSTCLIFTLTSLSPAMDTAKEEADPVREAALASIRNGRPATKPIDIGTTEDKKTSSLTRLAQPKPQRSSFASTTNTLPSTVNRFNSPHSH